MVSDTPKITESQQRRAAQRQSLLLAKTRKRDPGNPGQDAPQLIDAERNMIAYADQVIQQAVGLDP